jgi:protein phosphatase
MRLQSVAKTNVGLVRSMNQDAILEMAGRGIFLVADGMGGEKAGEEASAQVVETVGVKFEAFFEKAPTGPSQIEGEMRDSLLLANRDVFQISVREPEKRGLGSTASLLCLHRGVYFCAQVGDSRVYLMRGGNVQQITRDHTLVWALYEQGAIGRDQLETHPDRHLLTQCIGNERPVKVDTFMGQAQVGDVFLICSDGLTGYAKEPAVFEILKQEELGLEERAELLIQAALNAGGGDNVSAILVRVAELEDQDGWEPEETAPPAKFDETDTHGAFATSMRKPLDELDGGAPTTGAAAAVSATASGAMSRRRRLIVGGVTGLAIMAALILFLGGVRQVRVYIEAAGQTPAEIRVQAWLDKGTPFSQSMQRDADGMFFELPESGQWSLALSAGGFIPIELTVKVPDGARTVRHDALNWEKEPVLTLLLPTKPAATRVRVMLQTGAEENDQDIEFTREQLAAEERLDVPILPNRSYRVVASCDGHPDFVSPPQQLSPGQNRELTIFFAGSSSDSP